ncbi:Venom allergen 5, partial [Stegodyphus mimosarum]
MAAGVITIISAIALAFGFIECGRCPYDKFTPNHSFCKPPNPSCNILERGVGAGDRMKILKLHNDYRVRVAAGQETEAGGLPPAANMLEMVWDDELAAVAQKHAEQCNFQHDCSDCRRVERFRVGQNIYIAMNSEPPKKQDWDRVIKDFYDEVSTFNRNYIKPFVFGSYGHFTQVVWAETWKVGCGYVLYKDPQWYNSFFVCNYGPAGNWMDGEMYKAGKTCSACPEGTCCGADCSRKYNVIPKYSKLCMVVKGN